MNSTLYLSASALIYTGIIGTLFFTKKKRNTAENRIFKKIIIVTFISLIVEISILFFTLNKLALFIPVILKIFNICIVSWVFVFGLYSFVISHKENDIDYKQKYKIVYTIYKLFYVLTIIAIILLPVYLFTEPNKGYSYGPSVNVVYGVCGLLIFIMLTFLLKNIKNIKQKGYYPIIIFILLMDVVAFIQNTHPEVLLTNALFGLIVMILYHTIENPDLKMLHEMELAKDMAEKSNRAKSDFLSSMSHEIRTPLNAIVGFGQLIGTAETLEEAQSNSEDILNASQVLLEIVGNVLDMAKIESGNIEIMDSIYNPKEMFESIIKLVDYKFKEKNLPLNIMIAPDLPTTLYGDHANIRKVILNLLTNAVKYTNEGYVNLNVNYINKEDICRLIIAVEDTGRGIKPENIQKLFTKFNRLEEDKNTTTEGTGLGLAISKHILELMGGNVTVQSVYGSGSKFTITLNQRLKQPTLNQENFIKENDSVIQNDTRLETPVIQTDILKNSIDLTGKKILLIDDNKLNLKIANKLLGGYNCEVHEAICGQDCINKINRGEKFDLLLCDEMMPNMTGTQMMKELKSRGYNVPMVALTADVELNSKEKYISNGFDDYLAKPINKEELERVLTKFLK